MLNRYDKGSVLLCTIENQINVFNHMAADERKKLNILLHEYDEKESNSWKKAEEMKETIEKIVFCEGQLETMCELYYTSTGEIL